MTLSTKKSWIGLGIILLTLFIFGCGPTPEEQTAVVQEVSVSESTITPLIQITKTPVRTATPTTLEMFKAMSPDYHVYFDGEECIVEGPSEINTGEYLFILHNQTDLPTILVLGSYFGEGTFDNHLYWLEENCEVQGFHCEDDDGFMFSYVFVTGYFPKKQANEGYETYYRLYDITMERQYLIEVSLDGYWGWLCAPIQVSNSP